MSSNQGFGKWEDAGKPFDITGEYAFRDRRTWIKGKFFYLRGGDLFSVKKCSCCKRYDSVYPIRKYRFLRFVPTSYQIRIMPLKKYNFYPELRHP